MTDRAEIYKTTFIGFSPFVRYYLGNHETVKPFASLSAGWRYNQGHLTSRIDQTDEVDKASSFIYGITAGVALFLNAAVSFNVTANYTGATLFYLDYPDTRFQSMNYGRSDALRIGLGFQVYLGRDKHILPCSY
ncbi:hypothetical protein IC229_34415 [Spirosoma sp. BT702]|uniref:Uncharacterized protein n=1 Tax=Spirosoma profusum TaxID=2771354 RepID=A0A927AWP3_9BACT|nr:hypothetical protein [Spirosoma profusum]MBD2705751.1 hypothetical protein [Spirosoma profusum]